MSTAAHTPGPWEANLVGGVWWIHQTKDAKPVRSVLTNWATGMPIWPTPEPVCCIAGERAKPDALLIASAPELLDALQRLLAQCERTRLLNQPNTDAEKNAFSVIAKATGGA